MTQFHVVRVAGWETSFMPNDEVPYIFYSELEATRYAEDMAYRTGHKYQLRPIKSDIDWRQREVDRFASGFYTKVPWHKEPWVLKAEKCVDHFTHVSRQNQANVAFIDSTAKGERDVKTRMRASRYLTNYYGTILKEDSIRYWVAQYKKLYDKENRLLYAFEAKDIERVYKRGPHSCMKAGNFRSKIHPARVYSGPDLAVAYIEKGGKITARSVIWPKKKIYSRVYGDRELMETLLEEEEGFKEASLEGARLTKVKQGNRYVCPYIDGGTKISVGSKYLRVNKNGKHACRNQDGFCGRGFRCALCNQEHVLKNEQPPVAVIGAYYCPDCIRQELEAEHIFLCAHSKQYFPREVAVSMFNGDLWHRCYIDGRTGFQCVECNLNYPTRGGHAHTRVGYDRYSGRNTYKCLNCATRQHEMELTVATSSQ